jgi:TonB family protein
LAAGVAALVCRWMRHGPAGHRHAVWVVALIAAVLLPMASVRRAQPAATLHFDPSLAAVTGANALPQQTAQASRALPPASRTISFAETTAAILLGAYFLFVLYRFARLAWASIRTVQIRGRARYPAIPEALDRVWMRCQEAFGLTDVELLVSAQVSGPVTAGRAIILPESLLAEPSEDVLTTVAGHEMAHVARRDFACNVLYEVLYLPVSFHPAAWLIHREIERTREMACDEMVTDRLMAAGAYARSIMSIAAAMMALPRPGYTLGVFDGDILEARIRRLVDLPAANLKRARLLLATGLAAMALCAVLASSLALTARAQGGAQAPLKQGEAAYNRGDYKEAATQFESAVQMEPANVKAKLLLAHALQREYVPGPGADDSLAARAWQQYLDVLALEPGNKRALEGLMILATNTKQFAEAHEWALKAIQADATNADAYYTAGFVDWALTYPDYAAARLAAGMKPADPGIIPDAALRQKLRSQHGAQLEDGFRVLQIALQINPEYVDAMAYINLLYRIQAAIADTDAQSADLIAKANDWVRKALAAKRRQAANTHPPSGTLDVDGPAPGPWTAPHPPPPPPPPPPAGYHPANVAETPQRITIGSNIQQMNLVRHVYPFYPPEARQAGVSGVVRLNVVIARDGTVANIEVAAGPPLLAQAAIDAVRQWVYRPTLLNGVPVEVATTVEVNFAAGGQ